MWQNARWLKVPMEEIKRKEIYHGDMTGRFAYFRCEMELPEKAQLTVDISASSRYRLWVNGSPVLSGPCKGDERRQYYETVELTETMAGVVPEGIGWEHVRIQPCPMDLGDLQGKAATPKGDVSFRYEKTDGVWHYFLELPEGMEATFIYPDGRAEHLCGGKGAFKADEAEICMKI